MTRTADNINTAHVAALAVALVQCARDSAAATASRLPSAGGRRAEVLRRAAELIAEGAHAEDVAALVAHGEDWGRAASKGAAA